MTLSILDLPTVKISFTKACFRWCDIVIYSKKHVWSSFTVPSTELLNPWDFLGIESHNSVFCYVNEITFGKHLRIGADCQGK